MPRCGKWGKPDKPNDPDPLATFLTLVLALTLIIEMVK